MVETLVNNNKQYFKGRISVFLAVFLSCFLITSNAWAAFGVVNGENADSVLGQADFVSGSSGTGNNRFASPRSVVVDAATGKVFVADSSHHRVLRFSSADALTNGAAAEAVLGQTNFTNISANRGLFFPTAATLNAPRGLAMESGNLWVADYRNNRVLRFDNAATIASGAFATQVLGQANFGTTASGNTNSSLFRPIDLTIRNNNLWVVDANNHRVIRFDAVTTKPLNGGATADSVLGQANFNQSASGTSSTRFEDPSGIVIDSSGVLWISDTTNQRILRFDNAATLSNGAAADGVLGQATFTTDVSGTTQAMLREPGGLDVDGSGRLFVTDIDNYRVLIFNSAATKANGANADFVLGQPDFVTNTYGVTQNTFSSVSDVFVDTTRADTLWVADRGNHRVLRFVLAALNGGNATQAVPVFGVYGLFALIFGLLFLSKRRIS